MGGERKREGNLPINENASPSTPNNAIKVEFIAVEGRTRKQRGTQWLKRNDTVSPSRDPRSAGVDVGRRTNERVVEVERLW